MNRRTFLVAVSGICLLASVTAVLAEEFVFTTDGRQILLKDDGTYLVVNPVPKPGHSKPTLSELLSTREESARREADIRARLAPADQSPADPSYPRMEFEDIALDADKLHGQKIEVSGFLMPRIVLAELQGVFLSKDSFSRLTLPVRINQLSREQKRLILTKCASGCAAIVKGEFSQSRPTSLRELVAHDVQIRTPR